MEVLRTDVLSLFLAETYVPPPLPLIYFCLRSKRSKSSKGIIPEPLSAFLFGFPLCTLLVYPLSPVPPTHPDPRELRLFRQKRGGGLKDGNVGDRMPGLFYAYKTVMLPLHPPNPKAQWSAPRAMLGWGNMTACRAAVLPLRCLSSR